MSPLDDLRKFRDHLRRQLDADETFRTWQEVSSAIKRLEGGVNNASDLSLAKIRNHLTHPYPLVPTRAPDVSVALIERKGMPMTTPQLFSELIDAGIVFDGRIPIKNLRSVLSKDPRLESISWRGERAWWLKGQPLPEVYARQTTLTIETAPSAPTDGAANSSGVVHSGQLTKG